MKRLLPLILLLVLLCACVKQPTECQTHEDVDQNLLCDQCGQSVVIIVDFYNINDLHGKLADGEGHPGVDELTTFLKKARSNDDYAVLLSTGDMWQGSSESNLTYGNIVVDWMNELQFAAMALGNHEYDWGEAYIQANAELAQFPFLAINVYDRQTNSRVDYCQASVVVDFGSIQVGIIGAMGDCYSSISPEKVRDVYFKTGSELTALVKAECDRLRDQGVDMIVYTIHDGWETTASGNISD
jgi:2',3'-cyclic-nucleotide 2'-phosphodiesterase (5'-nucleotidase family)